MYLTSKKFIKKCCFFTFNPIFRNYRFTMGLSRKVKNTFIFDDKIKNIYLDKFYNRYRKNIAFDFLA
jgi:hypothetical protein